MVSGTRALEGARPQPRKVVGSEQERGGTDKDVRLFNHNERVVR